MNAIDFLTKEHDKVRTMLADIADNSHQFETKKKRFDLLAEDLIRHEQMEHQVWYPHFKSKLPDTVKHLVKEESYAEKAIKKLQAISSENSWNEHFIKFKQDVPHHADEEEHDLFTEVNKILSKSQLLEIGAKMFAFKQKDTKH